LSRKFGGRERPPLHSYNGVSIAMISLSFLGPAKALIYGMTNCRLKRLKGSEAQRLKGKML